MKWTVQRYVLREVVQTWLAVTGILVAILVSNQLSRVLGQAAENQYGRGVVLDLIALGAIMNLSVIVPVGLLLAVVLTLGRMYHDSKEVALADTATYSKAGAGGMHLVTLFNGRRYEGVPGKDDFRVTEFREHGIPIATPQDAKGPLDPDTKPTAALLGSHDPSDIAQLQFRASTPLMALVLTLIAVPLSKLRPRQGRYARVGFAIVVYFVYFYLLSASKIWLERSDLPPAIGVWWVHAAALGLGLDLLIRDPRKAC